MSQVVERRPRIDVLVQGGRRRDPALVIFGPALTHHPAFRAASAHRSDSVSALPAQAHGPAAQLLGIL